jgi:hypothetical protein
MKHDAPHSSEPTSEARSLAYLLSSNSWTLRMWQVEVATCGDFLLSQCTGSARAKHCHSGRSHTLMPIQGRTTYV